MINVCGTGKYPPTQTTINMYTIKYMNKISMIKTTLDWALQLLNFFSNHHWIVFPNFLLAMWAIVKWTLVFVWVAMYTAIETSATTLETWKHKTITYTFERMFKIHWRILPVTIFILHHVCIILSRTVWKDIMQSSKRQ